MKVYSIGREGGCDIVIHDSTDVISRRHATLNVLPSGKMTIVDQSHNGTYVNGIRISPNVPVPVTRKDNISLAHVARLDWNMVPKPINPVRYIIIAIVALVVIAAAIFGYKAYDRKNQPAQQTEQNSLPTDTTSNKTKTDSVKTDVNIKEKEEADKEEKEKTAKEKKSDKRTSDSKKDKQEKKKEADKPKATDGTSRADR